MFFFFFSSRRRHTRLQGDWSSDVCSSDLCILARDARPKRPSSWCPGDVPGRRGTVRACRLKERGFPCLPGGRRGPGRGLERKSTRLNSSHLVISYAGFCLKKKKKIKRKVAVLS